MGRETYLITLCNIVCKQHNLTVKMQTVVHMEADTSLTHNGEHLNRDRSSPIFQHLQQSEECCSLCSDKCFSIPDHATTHYQVKIKKALHIHWEQPTSKGHVVLAEITCFHDYGQKVLQVCFIILK